MRSNKKALKVTQNLTSLLNYAPHAPSRLTRLRVFLALLALHALLTRFIYAPCTRSLRTLCTLFSCLKIFLEWIFSTSKTFHFSRTIKNTINRAVLIYIKNS